MQQLQLVSFALALAALVVCGRIFTLKSRKKLPTLRPAVPDEHQPGCLSPCCVPPNLFARGQWHTSHVRFWHKADIPTR
jgi:hypothetical protein